MKLPNGRLRALVSFGDIWASILRATIPGSRLRGFATWALIRFAILVIFVWLDSATKLPGYVLVIGVGVAFGATALVQAKR